MSSKSPSPTPIARRQPSQRRRRVTLRAQDTSTTTSATKRLKLTHRTSDRGGESPDPIDDVVRLFASDLDREKHAEVEEVIEEESQLAECQITVQLDKDKEFWFNHLVFDPTFNIVSERRVWTTIITQYLAPRDKQLVEEDVGLQVVIDVRGQKRVWRKTLTHAADCYLFISDKIEQLRKQKKRDIKVAITAKYESKPSSKAPRAAIAISDDEVLPSSAQRLKKAHRKNSRPSATQQMKQARKEEAVVDDMLRSNYNAIVNQHKCRIKHCINHAKLCL